MTENSLFNFLGDHVGENRDESSVTPPARIPHIDVGALRERADSRSPEEVARVVEEIDRLTFARDALDMGRDYRELGDLDRACHWFTVAAAYGAEDADVELASTTALHEVFASIAETDKSAMCDRLDGAGGVRSRREREIIRKAVEVLEKARRVADETMSNAEKKAASITSAAHFRTLLAIGSDSCPAINSNSPESLAISMSEHEERARNLWQCGADGRRLEDLTWWRASALGQSGGPAVPWLPSLVFRGPGAQQLKLFGPGWDRDRRGHIRTPRERITPGPKLRRALNKLSARTSSPGAAAMAVAG